MLWNHQKEMEDNCITYEEHQDVITKLIVLNKKYICSGSVDSTIKRWCPKNSGTIAELTYSGHQATVTDLVVMDNK